MVKGIGLVEHVSSLIDGTYSSFNPELYGPDEYGFGKVVEHFRAEKFVPGLAGEDLRRAIDEYIVRGGRVKLDSSLRDIMVFQRKNVKEDGDGLLRVIITPEESASKYTITVFDSSVQAGNVPQ